jgi:hypothetical protein
MRDQDQTRTREHGQGAEKSREHKYQRQRIRVDEIVDRGSQPRSADPRCLSRHASGHCGRARAQQSHGGSGASRR